MLIPRLLFCSLLVPVICLAQPDGADAKRWGHSAHGEAFDGGPRQRPWKMEGIGEAPFPIATASAEAQEWFNQGNALLHSFWYYEAERSFRWALKLDPECAMCFWGLARAAQREDPERSRELIREAAKRKGAVTPRERLYIEAWEKLYLPEEPGEAAGANRREYRRLLQAIPMEHPDDVEAKALYALEFMWQEPYGAELAIREILAKNPRHPGAHHYRVHAWDGEYGRFALESSKRYGEIAYEAGHALHMPGHVYSAIGMWHEAAIAMDKATRVENAYMQRRMAFPFNDFNYKHNRNYLSYIQEQLGMAESAIAGAREILAAPHDPKYNQTDNFYGSRWQGRIALLRAMVKFGRWEELLEPAAFEWGDSVREKTFKAYVETLAHAALGDGEAALRAFREHEALEEGAKKEKDGRAKRVIDVQYKELPGVVRLVRGDVLGGLAALAEAAEAEARMRESLNDPPYYPHSIYNSLGRAYLDESSPRLAAEAFEKALAMTPNDGFALAGLAEAWHALGEKEKARDSYGRLLHVWSGADPGLAALERVRRLHLDAQPRDEAPGTQREYRLTPLDELGPSEWEPFPAPRLDALDSQGGRVTLGDYRGRNVLLVFYFGDECVHCMEQLVAIQELGGELHRLDVDVLAISSAGPERNAQSAKLGELPFRLLSDPSHENARRFLSYDEFEEIELHSTIFVDRKGRMRWARFGGEPFMDFGFLIGEIERSEAFIERHAAGRASE